MHRHPTRRQYSFQVCQKILCIPFPLHKIRNQSVFSILYYSQHQHWNWPYLSNSYIPRKFVLKIYTNLYLMLNNTLNTFPILNAWLYCSQVALILLNCCVSIYLRETVIPLPQRSKTLWTTRLPGQKPPHEKGYFSYRRTFRFNFFW